jgi:hypothetical protein
MAVFLPPRGAGRYRARARSPCSCPLADQGRREEARALLQKATASVSARK